MAGKRKDIVFHVRMSADEKAEFEQLADQFGLSIAEAIRRAVRAAMGYGPVLTDRDRNRFDAIYQELNSIGVNVNQAVRAMNTGRVPDDAEIRSMLVSLSNSLTALGELYVMQAAKARTRAKRVMADG
ncbi:hypothetical protein GCM10011491_41800 [Brucella endophytica]|uniref:Bacterial mobilisation domain-containing protein n=2 Tax=Brucella endophytica TaxID=1963359 RepID=A0A916WLI5_9HYPH|nr:hypothetical protein GCM10011491_41800 [Brucella endophytica]